MQKKTSKYIQGTALVLAGIVVGGFGVYGLTPEPTSVDVLSQEDITTAIIAAQGTMPTAEDIAMLAPVCGDSEQAVNAYDTLLQDDIFETVAELLATEEFEDHDYKDIYNAIDDLYEDIDDRKDIVYADVKDTDFDDMDADDQDGTVIQELKVRYETTDGDKVNRYLTVTTEIEDGEVEDQTITETE